MKPGEMVAGRYRLNARLGVGGMGEVWRATHTGTGRDFALKFMHAHVAASATARERFSREARASAAVNHPSVIDVFDIGEHDESPYLAMELLDGISLGDAFHATPPLSLRDLCVVMYDTARALAAAHAAGIIHRDVKPANIFLHKDRASGFAAAKILDFGISKFSGLENQTETGSILGSPRYMSPEQTRAAAAVDPLADVWACGVILFEGITGTWPHDGDSYSSLVVAICTVPPRSIDKVAPDVPEPVRAIVRDCLEPRDTRLPSAAALADRLTAALADPALAARPLARPLHPSSDPAKAVSGVRIRSLLSSTGSALPVADLAYAPPGASLPAASLRLPNAPAPLATTSGLSNAPTLEMPGTAGPRSAPLDGTLESLATTTLRDPRSSATPPLPISPSSNPGVAAPTPARGLRMALAALGVLFVAIVVTLVGLLRSGPAPADGTVAAASGPPAPSPSTSAATALAPPAPTARPAPSATASASAEAKRTTTPPSPPPVHAPPPAPPPVSGSRVKQLGSGL